MGRASNAKRVAREARASGTVEPRPKRRLAYPLGVLAAVVIGVIVVVIARQPAETKAPVLDIPAASVTDSTIEGTAIIPTDSTDDPAAPDSSATTDTTAAP